MATAATLLYQRYRLIALAVDIAVLFAGLSDWLFTGLGPRSLILSSAENLRFAIFVLSVLALISLELWGAGAARFDASFARSAKVATPFLARLALAVGACLVTDLFYSQMLFLPIVLYTYLAVDKSLSYVLAVFGVAVLLGVKLFDATEIAGPSRLAPMPPADSLIDRGALERGLLGHRANRFPLGRLIDESMGALITLFFTLLLARAIAQATQAQQKLTGLLSSLEASHMQLKQYAARVADLAATEERNRLARDIHDSLGHHLAAINIQLEKANAYRERDPKRAYEAVSHAQRTVQDALKDVRESVSSLRRESEPFLFEKALDGLLKRMRHSELDIRVEILGESSRYSRLKLMTLYRVIQEGLTNVHKHAGASQVTIGLSFKTKQAELTLSDNGAGFDVSNWKTSMNKQTTQGLTGLQERLSLVGGIFEIKRQRQRTTLTASIPHASFQTHQTIGQ